MCWDQVIGSFEEDNETAGFINSRTFLNQLNNYQTFKKEPTTNTPQHCCFLLQDGSRHFSRKTFIATVGSVVE